MSEKRISIFIQGRPDGGLRIYSPDVPGLILSHSNPELAGSDIVPALRVLRPDLFLSQSIQSETDAARD